MITPALISQHFEQNSKQEALYHSLLCAYELSPQCWVEHPTHPWEEKLPYLTHHINDALSHCDIIHLQGLSSPIISKLHHFKQNIILSNITSPEILKLSKPIRWRKIKQKHVQQIRKLTLVAPTRARVEQLSQIPLFYSREKRHICHPINCEQFCKRPRIICKEHLGIAPQLQIIAFRCSSPNQHNKKQIESVCQELYRNGIVGLHILILGTVMPLDLPYPNSCLYMEEKESATRARILNAITILTHLSAAEDDHPRLLESKACQTPIICNKQAELQEYIKDKCSGHLLEDTSPNCIAHHITHLLRHPILCEHCGLHAREDIVRQHEQSLIARQYKRLYEEQLASQI